MTAVPISNNIWMDMLAKAIPKSIIRLCLEFNPTCSSDDFEGYVYAFCKLMANNTHINLIHAMIIFDFMHPNRTGPVSEFEVRKSDSGLLTYSKLVGMVNPFVAEDYEDEYYNRPDIDIDKWLSIYIDTNEQHRLLYIINGIYYLTNSEDNMISVIFEGVDGMLHYFKDVRDSMMFEQEVKGELARYTFSIMEPLRENFKYMIIDPKSGAIINSDISINNINPILLPNTYYGEFFEDVFRYVDPPSDD